MKWHRPLATLAPLRLKYLLLVVLVLGAIFFALAYLGIHNARQSLRQIMVNEGRALIESLTLSAGNAIQAGLLLESLSESKFVELAQVAQQRLYGRSEADLYRQFRDEHNLLSVDILDSSLVVLGSDRWASGYRPPYPPEVAAEIHDIRLMGGGYRTLTIHGDSLLPVVQYFVYAFEPGGALVVMTAPADYLDQITRQIGIGYLIRRISQQAGIDYILLQSRDGIIFASRQVQPVPNVASDPFLETLLAADTIGWRRHFFEGEEVLEIARRFESVEYPPGVFRLGLSLDEYGTISRGYDRQIIAIAVVFFLLTLLVVAVVSINQNYFILDQSFKRMRSLTETIFDRFSGAVLAFDADGKIIAVNRALTELCGLNAGIIGRKLTEVAAALPFDLLPPAEPGQKAISVEKDITTISGEKKTVLMGVSALPVEAGGGAVWLIQDVTEQKRLEEENRRRERLSELGDLAAGVAHEIRNPLNSIAIAGQRLQTEFEVAAGREEYQLMTRTIVEEASRLNQILIRFLELTRRRAEDDQILDLAEPIRKAILTMAEEAGSRNVLIDYSSHEAVAVRGNEDKLEQLFINLIKNSLQAVSENGRITLTVDNSGADQVKITVADNGPGFPAEVLPKIFQPYFTTKPDGSGLGLALVYKTVTEMGGRITAGNDRAGGAIITIELPSVRKA